MTKVRKLDLFDPRAFDHLITPEFMDEIQEAINAGPMTEEEIRAEGEAMWGPGGCLVEPPLGGSGDEPGEPPTNDELAEQYQANLDAEEGYQQMVREGQPLEEGPAGEVRFPKVGG